MSLQIQVKFVNIGEQIALTTAPWHMSKLEGLPLPTHLSRGSPFSPSSVQRYLI